MSFCATDSNLYYINDISWSIRTSHHLFFDEAHMTVPAALCCSLPLTSWLLHAQILDRYHSYLQSSQFNADWASHFHCHPTYSCHRTVYWFDLHLDLDTVTVQSNSTSPLLTDIAAMIHTCTLHLGAVSLSNKIYTHLLALLIRISLKILLLFFTLLTILFSYGDKIAQLIVEQATTPSIQLVSKLATMICADSGFSSTNAINVLLPQDSTKSLPPPVDPVIPSPKEPPDTTPLSFYDGLAAPIQWKTVALTTYAVTAATLDMDYSLCISQMTQLKYFSLDIHWYPSILRCWKSIF